MRIKKEQKIDQSQSSYGTNDQYTTVDFVVMTKELVKAGQNADSSKTTDVFFNSEVEYLIVGKKIQINNCSWYKLYSRLCCC